MCIGNVKSPTLRCMRVIHGKYLCLCVNFVGSFVAFFLFQQDIGTFLRLFRTHCNIIPQTNRFANIQCMGESVYNSPAFEPEKIIEFTQHTFSYIFFWFVDSIVLVPVNVYRSLCRAPIALTIHYLSCVMWIVERRSGLRFNIYRDTSTIFTVSESICVLWTMLKVEVFDALLLPISHILFWLHLIENPLKKTVLYAYTLILGARESDTLFMVSFSHSFKFPARKDNFNQSQWVLWEFAESAKSRFSLGFNHSLDCVNSVVRWMLLCIVLQRLKRYKSSKSSLFVYVTIWRFGPHLNTDSFFFTVCLVS